MTSMVDLRTKPRKTLQDFLALPDETRAELIDGELTVMTASPFTPHQRASLQLTLHLAPFLDSGPKGLLLTAPMDVHLPSGDIVEPDLLWVSEQRRGMVKRYIEGAPDLLVEILSPSSLDRDRHVKKALYARNGVKEYWIVDPEEKSVEVFTLAGERYEPAGYHLEGGTVASPLLPGLAIPVAAVFKA